MAKNKQNKNKQNNNAEFAEEVTQTNKNAQNNANQGANRE
ncbi:MAG: hypothetical protein K0Q59_1002 [Paenibacillus sp.]|jgi:hypothetical protein|nr:hypothetical protein [Paenibacillus sp.]